MIFAGIQKLDLLNYPGKVSCTVFTRGCNFRCPYCHNPSLVDPSAFDNSSVDEEEVLSYLESRKKMLESVVVTGGEPTMHRGIEDFYRKVKEMGFYTKLDTNGTNPEFLGRLLELSLIDYAAMDFKAPFEKYDLVGGEKYVEKMKESLKILSSSSVQWEIRTTCAPSVVKREDLQRISEYMEGLACKYTWYLQNFNPAVTLNSDLHEEHAYEPGVLEKYAAELTTLRGTVLVR